MRAPRRKVTLNFPASDDREIPHGMFLLAERRTEHLYRHVRKPITELLVSAYMQGMNDAFDVADTPAGRTALFGDTREGGAT